jgi:hypothetical protein
VTTWLAGITAGATQPAGAATAAPRSAGGPERPQPNPDLAWAEDGGRTRLAGWFRRDVPAAVGRVPYQGLNPALTRAFSCCGTIRGIIGASIALMTNNFRHCQRAAA